MERFVGFVELSSFLVEVIAVQLSLWVVGPLLLLRRRRRPVVTGVQFYFLCVVRRVSVSTTDKPVSSYCPSVTRFGGRPDGLSFCVTLASRAEACLSAQEVDCLTGPRPATPCVESHNALPIRPHQLQPGPGLGLVSPTPRASRRRFPSHTGGGRTAPKTGLREGHFGEFVRRRRLRKAQTGRNRSGSESVFRVSPLAVSLWGRGVSAAGKTATAAPATRRAVCCEAAAAAA
jgi:hypothetical protein